MPNSQILATCKFCGASYISGDCVENVCSACKWQTPAEAKNSAALRLAAGSEAALQAVLKERRRQEAKWGEQNHDPFTYIAILTEEVGELSQAALHHRFGGSAAGKLREEAIHTAAVALAIVECLDRAKWSWPHNNDSPH